jgi:hypothetical protein
MSCQLSLIEEPWEVVVTVDWNLFSPKVRCIICIQQDSNLYDDYQTNKILEYSADIHNLNRNLLPFPTRTRGFWDNIETFKGLAWDLEWLQ